MANRAQERLRFKKGYGENWKRLRESKEKTVREFAKIIQMSYSSISKIENEIVTPTIAQINLYQEHFDCSLDYLTGYSTSLTTNLADVCKYTGLSVEAAEFLHRAVIAEQIGNDDQTEHLKIFSDLLDSFYGACIDIRHAISIERTKKSAWNNISEAMNPNSKEHEKLKAFTDLDAIALDLSLQVDITSYFTWKVTGLLSDEIDEYICSRTECEEIQDGD